MNSPLATVKNFLKRTPFYMWYVRTRDFRRATDSLRHFSAHDMQMKVFYGAFVKPGDLVFDVGANMGNRTKILLSLGAKVVAIEPQAHCVRALQTAFGGHPHLQIVPKGLGARESSAVLHVNQDSTLSTLSDEWISATSATNRFRGRAWKQTQTIQLTTMDALIARFGHPVFTKIDVEGYEKEVLAGLSEPLPIVSLEFAAESIDSILQCIDRLSTLADGKSLTFNFSEGESMYFTFDSWVDADQLRAYLEKYRHDYRTFGDIYVRVA